MLIFTSINNFRIFGNYTTVNFAVKYNLLKNRDFNKN